MTTTAVPLITDLQVPPDGASLLWNGLPAVRPPRKPLPISELTVCQLEGSVRLCLTVPGFQDELAVDMAPSVAIALAELLAEAAGLTS